MATKAGPHDLTATLEPSYYWLNDIPGDYEMDEFATGDNFPAYISVVPKGDIDKDEYVNFKDFAAFANKWLNTNCSPANDWCDCTDLDKDNSVGVSDLMTFTEDWLKCVDSGNPDCDSYWQESQ